MESGILDQPPTKEHTNGNNIDRISELPDSVLHHILSFLTTKYTVQTSLLSKRWRHLWASVPALDLTDESFDRVGDGSREDFDTHNFENFVDTVLLLRDASDLRSFSLRCYNYFDEGHVHRWIRHATKYNPKVLQIEFPEGVICRLPLGILPCRSLEELSMTLDYNVELGPPKIMGCLRRLHIQWAFGENGLMENLNSSCPVLEDLDLHNCELDALCISSNTLKRLSIKDCKIGGNENLISTPGLVCLTFTNNSACTTLENLSSLLNATVHTTGDHAIKLIRGLANVETLNFSCSEDYQCELPEELSLFPMFDNLRSLTLGGQCTSDEIQVVACFLQHSPNLTTFTLNNREVSSPLSLSRWKVSQKSGKLTFSCPRLELIEIQCSKRDKKLQELIKYLLSNATGVPRIVINRD